MYWEEKQETKMREEGEGKSKTSSRKGVYEVGG